MLYAATASVFVQVLRREHHVARDKMALSELSKQRRLLIKSLLAEEIEDEELIIWEEKGLST